PDEWAELLDDRCAASLSPHAPAPGANAIDAHGRPGLDFAPARQRPDENPYDAFADAAAAARREGRRAILAATSDGARDRLVGVLREHGLDAAFAAQDWPSAAAADAGPPVVTFPAERGFKAPDLLVVTEQDLLGDRLVRRAKRRRKADAFIADVSTLAEGDYVVHLDHGVGRYDGLQPIDVGGAPHDCLKLAYHGGDTLYVPVENLEVLSRYGSADAEAALDRLGGAAWQGRKAKAKKRLRDMAEALMKIAAARALREGRAVHTPDGLYHEFAARFPYSETEDQLRAIETVFDDLASGRPMDRLICGDVGFGKTEVALRAAFAATIGAGMQVAVAAPTTLLARQHFKTFTERFKGLPIRVAQLSRFVTTKEANETKAALKAGDIDIVIGTHALFGPGVGFHDLGLLIVDEEQHFGVKQKEKLKALRAEVHVMTLTATPIPRTLQLSLAGVRDMSVIATPPVDRLAVRTFVTPEDPVVLREAILRERARSGQIFVVCPRIQHLETVEEQIRRWVPDLKIAVAHGRMAAKDLDEIMNRFYDGQYEALISTNIVESGIDVPNANTMIVHRADLFGLSQLYQLRGRIGRSKRRAYCYLTLPPQRTITESAQRRLTVMQTLDSLGAGFQLASHDMDIRGAGNLLGEEQHGHIKEVGVELYQRMLEEAVATAQAEAEGADAPEDAAWTPTINLGASVMIPEGYVADLTVR
ncbi:MAG: transcription-repair coupling factor, partial [Pseudomonadota bacterium]